MPQQVEVNEAVGIGVKNVPTSIAALSYMMRNVQGDHASQTSHGRHKISEKLENVPSVPRFPPLRTGAGNTQQCRLSLGRRRAAPRQEAGLHPRFELES